MKESATIIAIAGWLLGWPVVAYYTSNIRMLADGGTDANILAWVAWIAVASLLLRNYGRMENGAASTAITASSADETH